MNPELRKKYNEHQQKLDLIKTMNGLTEKQMQNPQFVENLELMLEELDIMTAVSYFNNLRSLTLVHCGLYKIDGLKDQVSLIELNLDENFIQSLDGVQNLVSLESMVIQNNKIKQISHLAKLTNLKKLWLNNNKIDTIENLETLVNIEQLWIAGNQIEEIRVSLDKLQNLEDLNISGNKICSFKEALNLNRLNNLKILSFYDPHFGENPICNLCNYQTYVLYHLRNIVKLDTLYISDEAKCFAEATFMKKKMYYNMRIKTIQRCFSTLGKLIKKAKKIKQDSLNEDIANLQLKISQLQEIIEVNQIQQPELPQFQAFYEDKLDEIEHVEEVYESLKRKLYDTGKLSIHKLITELESGGNVRLEEGKQNEKWYLSCIDLIKSRFHQEEMQAFNIQDIEIKRVVRIHNRFLRNKFEEKMESLVDVSNSNYKKSLEYLFYGIDPKCPNEIYHVIEEGFRSPIENKQLGYSPYTNLVNSISGADSARISHFLNSTINSDKFKRKFINKRFPNGVQQYPSGLLLICKVLMIKSIQDPKHPYFNPTQSPCETHELFPLQENQFPEECTVFRVNKEDPKHKLWMVLDNNLVLPEYLVEYDYVMQDENQSKIADFGEKVGILDNIEDEFISPQNINTYKSEIVNIYNTLCEEVNNYQFENIEDLKHPNLEVKAQDLDRADISLIKITLLNYFKYCLSRSILYELNPNLLQESMIEGEITEDMVIANRQPELIQFLNLSNMKIENIIPYPTLINLTSLILSYNKIQEIHSLQDYKNLIQLDISHNQIHSIQGIEKLQNIKVLDLSHNDLMEYTDVQCLKQLKKLEDLKIMFNPFTQNKQVIPLMINLITSLKYLDNKKINIQQQHLQDQKKTQIITEQLIKEYGKRIQSKQLQQIYDQQNWKQQIEIINMTHIKLTKIANLEELVNLRQINLGHNLIESIQGLQNCKLLEEINLEKNKIQSITGLDQLIYLKKIELGKNKIDTIQGLENLTNLMQLSLEDNEIESLEGFPELKNLMELYIGNNRLTESKEIAVLKPLHKLIILDMSGNPFSKDPNYRIYSLFIINKLKVLDGISIEQSEQKLAKELFTGRLTEEILESRLYGQQPEDVTELDLSNCKLRDFEDIFNQMNFPNLAELNLSANLFQSTRILGYLPNLKILILNTNKIETLFYSQDIAMQRGLNGCQNLEILDISNNNLKDFSGLQFCILRDLKILKAYSNEIIKVDCLEHLKSLKELDVNHNKIRYFDQNSFLGQNPIKCLKIDDNLLKNFNNIQKLYKLQHLFANSNRINDIPDIDKLSELKHLKELELNGNALSRRPGYRMAVLKKLPDLLYLDGREVTIEEKERLDLLQGIEKQNQLPNINLQPNQNQKGYVPVRLNAINFDGVFSKK